MTRAIEDLLADEEAAIRDDGFSAGVSRIVRADRLRRRALLGAFGMTGLGLAAGGLMELLERGVRLLPESSSLSAVADLDPVLASDLLGRVSMLAPVELAVLAGAALALAAWVWQLVSSPTSH